MNLRRPFLLLLLCLSVAMTATAASPNIVMSQVYGGGGSSSGTPAYTNDYVELFNKSTAAVPIAGWSLQYGSSTGNFASTGSNLFVFPAGTSIPAGKYLLVKLGSAGSAGAPFSGDLTTGGLSMAAGSGKVVLASTNTALGCGASANPCAANDPRIVDLVAWGAANNAEGGVSVNNGTGLQSSQGAIRKSDGCVDTDVNGSDFVVATTATGLVPRTSASSPNVCGSLDQAPSIGAIANPVVTVNQDAAPFTVSLSGSDDNNVYDWSATAGAGISSVTVSGGQGTADVTYSVTLVSGFSGTASFTASLSDNVNAAATRVVNIGVTPTTANDAPSIIAFANPVATKDQDAAPFAVSLSGSDDNDVYTWSATPGSGVSAVTVSAGQSTADVTYSVTLEPGFSGTAGFTASLSDGVNAPVTANVTIDVTPAPPPPLDHIVISQVYGGGGNSGAAYQNDFVELYNPTLVSHDLSGWTIQYGSATGTTWQVHPLGGTIAPGEYYLIRLATNGTTGAVVPDANIDGSLNLSGSNGKVALVSSGDPLSGCSIGDETLVDLVGYGTSANCREGATNAPTTSNATAVFRKNGGFTDTNVNGADFVTGTPNPRRTTPIVELPPTVLSSDPRKNGTNAPRDASITVTFTEAVTVEEGWFSIDCVATGLHDSATVAPGGTNAWIIIPNVNFQAGEQCTISILKDFVRDADLDDAGTNTDLLTGNYSATFTVASGAAPAYSPDVHLTFGNPTGATADIDEPANYLMVKPEFALSYNRDRGTPNWVSWHLADEWIGTLARFDTFRADPAVPAEWYRVTHLDYSGSGFDRGHMVPNADRDPETSTPINQATFLMTNMIPQAPDNNQGPWADMENYLRTLLPANELYIVAGGAGDGGTGSNGAVTTIAGGHVAVPAYTWKVALVLPKDSGDDVSRVSAATRSIAVILPNVQGIRNNDWTMYLTSIDAVEALTGYDFFANVPDAIENAVEAGVNGVNPPGVADQSFNADEDTPEAIALEAVNGSDNALTYTIVTQPAHGTLSGSGANQTYTPAPDYFGTDSFTFHVSDGARVSNTATVSIRVYEVNDVPVASIDAPASSGEGAPVAATISASDVEGDALSIEWSVTKNGAPFANGSGAAVAFTPDDDGAYVITATVDDGEDSVTATATVSATNLAPVVNAVSGPATQLAAGSNAVVSLTFADAGAGDTHTATFAWGDSTTSTATCESGTCSASHAYAAAGIYTVAIALSDDDAGTASTSFGDVVVYDTNAGSVTGGGWISTPSGKATLTMNAQYQKDATLAGHLSFEKFRGTTFDWLVISGPTATLQGSGTVNGTGNYAFTATATDAANDTFAIRVTDKVTGAVVYEASGRLGGGNLTVH